MDAELTLPKLGLTMSEATIVEWRIDAGAAFRAGDLLAVLETDKIAHDFEAPTDGTLLRIAVDAGETVSVGTAIAYYAPNSRAVPDPGANASSSPVDIEPSALPAAVVPEPAIAVRQGMASPNARVRATPYARRLARSRGVSLQGLVGSGPRGRVVAEDVPVAAEPTPAVPVESAGAVDRRPATRFEAALARRLVRVNQDVPQFYLATEVDARGLLAKRDALRAEAGAPRVTVTHLILSAVARAFEANSALNRVWVDGDIVTFDGVDVGLAVDAPGGLVVPVLRRVERLRLTDIAESAARLVGAARDGSLTAADVGGGAVTVSNAGMHDVTWMYPLITPGQSVILGCGSVRDAYRPDGRGFPELRREIGLVMNFDHRVFDGVSGLRLLNAVKAALETPDRLSSAA